LILEAERACVVCGSASQPLSAVVYYCCLLHCVTVMYLYVFSRYLLSIHWFPCCPTVWTTNFLSEQIYTQCIMHSFDTHHHILISSRLTSKRFWFCWLLAWWLHTFSGEFHHCNLFDCSVFLLVKAFPFYCLLNLFRIVHCCYGYCFSTDHVS